MEALGDNTASVGGIKVNRRIATLLKVRKSEAVIINDNFLPLGIYYSLIAAYLDYTVPMQFDCPWLFSEGKLCF